MQNNKESVMKIEKFRLIPVFLFAMLFLGGCDFNDLMMTRPLKADDAAEYAVKGSFLYFTTDTEKSGPVSGLVLMFRDAPDLSIPLSGGIESFMLDMPTNCTGISRIAARYSELGTTKEYWFLESYAFSLATNRMNYLGRFKFTVRAEVNRTLIDMQISNVIEKDRPRFALAFTNQTNLDFVFIEKKKE